MKNEQGNTGLTVAALVGVMVLCTVCHLNMVFTVIIGMVVSMAVYFITIPMEAEKQKAKEQTANWPKFYQECAKYEINCLEDLKKPDKRQRAERLLRSKGLPFQSVEEVFSPDHPEFQRIRQAEQAKKAQDLARDRSRYEARAQENLELTKLHGLDKPLYMLNQQLRELNNDRSAPAYIPMKKESDGMIMAGLASGIGGTVPALASLNSTAKRNEAIRAQNEVAKSLNQAAFQAAGQTYKQRIRLERAIKQYSEKLTEDISPQLLFSKIKITTKEIKVTESRAIVISAEALANDDIQIFGKYPATIDGWIKAKVYDSAHALVGECPMPFPWWGARPYMTFTGPVDISGVLTSCGEPGQNYQVVYAPGDLWGMER